MWMNVNLDLHYHIDVMKSKISRRICMLKKIRSYLTEDLTTNLHNAMVLPLFDYCDTIYGQLKLQRLQNRGAKIILRVPKDTPTQIVLKYLKWLPLTKCITYHTHILMFKCLKGLASNYLSRNVKYVNHCHNTGYQDKQVLYVSKTKLKITEETITSWCHKLEHYQTTVNQPRH